MILNKTMLLIAAFISLYVSKPVVVDVYLPCVPHTQAFYMVDDSEPPSTNNEYLIHYYLPDSASSTFLASSSSTSLLSSVVVVEREIDIFYSSSQMEASLPQCSYTI